jgi:hypothetical protein
MAYPRLDILTVLSDGFGLLVECYRLNDNGAGDAATRSKCKVSRTVRCQDQNLGMCDWSMMLRGAAQGCQVSKAVSLSLLDVSFKVHLFFSVGTSVDVSYISIGA